MVEMLLSAVPFGDVKHTGDTILRGSKKLLTGYGVGQYKCITEKAFKFFDDEATNRKHK